jgi:hypothetical protein
MGTTNGLLCSGSIVLLLGSLLGLRIRYPKASQRSETVVLAVVAALFFSICGVFIHQ